MLPSSPEHEPDRLPAAYSALGTASVSGTWVLALAAGGALLDYFIRDACARNLQGNVTLAQPILAGSWWQMAQLQQRAGDEVADRSA